MKDIYRSPCVNERLPAHVPRVRDGPRRRPADPRAMQCAATRRATTGWTTARLEAGGMELTVHTNDPKHAWNGETRRLEWRT